MDNRSIVQVTEIFTDVMFCRGSRTNSEGYEVFPIVRPDSRINPIVIQRLMVATRNSRPLYFILWRNLPSMDAGEVEKEVIKDIMKCLVWENIK